MAGPGSDQQGQKEEATVKTGKTRVLFIVLALVVGITMLSFSPVSAQVRKQFKVVWSIYVGWMPWDYADFSGILKKWADANGISVKLDRMAYVPSISAYTSGEYDAVVATNMDTLISPARSGIDSTALIMGDYSNDNDQVLTRDGIGFNNLAGRQVYLVQGTVSSYLLNRCLVLKSKITEDDLDLQSVDDESKLTNGFLADVNQKVVVTWEPFVMQIAQKPGVRRICGSADIPGEILDLMVVRTDVLKANPALGRTLTGAWYEVMDLMTRRGDPRARAAVAYMAKASESTVTEFEQQLRTTAMFYSARSAVEYTESVELKQRMDLVRKFSFKEGLLGRVNSPDVIGIQYPDGTVQGDSKNVKLRFDSSYMRLAAEGKLTAR